MQHERPARQQKSVRSPCTLSAAARMALADVGRALDPTTNNTTSANTTIHRDLDMSSPLLEL